MKIDLNEAAVWWARSSYLGWGLHQYVF